MFKSVKKAIDKWNPYSLLPDASTNEFDFISHMITKRIAKSDNVDKITEVVSDVFTQMLEDEIPEEECTIIAVDIKDNIESARKLKNLRERAKKLKTDIPAVFIALKKSETPLLAKVVAGLTIGYALSPIDLIPDFIPVLGYLDDVIILPMLVALTIKLIPTNVFEECRTESKNLWENGKPKKWFYAIPIVLVWILLIFLVIRAIIK